MNIPNGSGSDCGDAPESRSSRICTEKLKNGGKKADDMSYVNPFIHKLELDDPLDKIKIYLLTVLLLPFRVICICIFLIIAWLLACIGLYGISIEELQKKPLTGWRKKLRNFAAQSMRALFVFGSFNYIKYKGIQASPKEAPILCVAPHSSFFDAIVVITTGPPSIVAKGETNLLPFFGKLINYTQPIYVWREDPDSRQNTIKSIIERANSEDDWPQVIIFPEGTCTNRNALITFKAGAFYPGVPIQPVCIRYPNKMDTFTWTWEGPGVLKLLWLTLTQVHSACEIEFLPVYNPSEEEKINPKLYAQNVRNVMAKALGIPVSDFTYDDCKVMSKAKTMKMLYAVDIVEIERLRKLLDLHNSGIEETIVNSFEINNTNYLVTLADFANYLKISTENKLTKHLFKIFDVSNKGTIDFRDYLLSAIFLNKQNESIIEILTTLSKIYGGKDEKLTNKIFHNILRHSTKINKEECDSIYQSIDKNQKGFITFNEFIEFIQQKPEYDYLLQTEEPQNNIKLKKQ